jgi:O-antigen/teichoic acid export membrane protein
MGLALVPTFLALPLFPMFVRMAANSLPAFVIAYNRTFKFFALICLPGTAFLFSWPGLWLSLVFGKAFIPAAPILQLLSLTLLPVFMMAIFPLLYSAFSKQWQLMLVLGGWLLVRLIAGILVIPKYGGLGSACIVVGSEFGILLTLITVFAAQDLKISLIQGLFRPLIAVTPMELLLWPFRGAPIIQLVPVAIAALLIYGSTAWIIGCLTMEEKDAILDRLGKVLMRFKGRGARAT